MKIGVVIVTRNRLECLKIALKKYDEQTKAPEYIIVVDNCSTDQSTPKFLDVWKDVPAKYEKIVIHSSKNSGGSGGFYIAEQEALKHDAEWIWHADDDAFPDKNALAAIEEAYASDHLNVAAYCASVKNIENPNEDISFWRLLYKGFFFIKWIKVKRTERYFDVDKFMYLGCVINKNALLSVGTTNRNFFIHEDDIEHSMRIRKYGRIIAVADSYLYHPAWKDINDPREINWKYYYSVRNKIISIGINCGEKYRNSELIKAKIKLLKHMILCYPQYVIKMERDAIHDGKHNILGKNSKYLPD